MRLHQSEENYLKAILLLHSQKTEIRKIDIAQLMDYTKASVSYMVKKLTERNYTSVIANNVCITEMGLDAATKVYERNTIVQNFLIDF